MTRNERIDAWFRAPDQGRTNEQIIKSRVAPVEVTPDELAFAVHLRGISPGLCEELVYHLLDKAETEALRRTFAQVEPAPTEAPAAHYDHTADVWLLSWITMDGGIGSTSLHSDALGRFANMRDNPDIVSCVLIQRHADKTQVIGKF